MEHLKGREAYLCGIHLMSYLRQAMAPNDACLAVIKCGPACISAYRQALLSNTCTAWLSQEARRHRHSCSTVAGTGTCKNACCIGT